MSVRTELAVVEQGEGDPLVVFVHGVLDRGRSFRRVARALDGECRAVWYDRRGYGAAVDARGTPAGVAEHADDLLAVLDGRRAIVVGHSFGGVTALGAALRAPDLVDALVLYETGMAWLPTWDDRFLRELLWGEDPAREGARLMYGERYERMSNDERFALERQARAFVAEERSVRRGEPPFDVARLRVPLVYGCGDRYPFPAVPDYLRSVLPGAEIVVVPGADHNAHRNHPDAFAGLVRRGIRLGSDVAS
ncbi:MAG: alpha/beta hydrolase [Acidimicrobiia bacterium]